MRKLKPSKRVQVKDALKEFRKRKPEPAWKVKDALKEFCDDIDQTGGLVLHDEGCHYVPAASDDWIDLGETYLKACKALGREPKICISAREF